MNYQRLTYACTVFLSSSLLFLVQPIVARTMLPGFGGSAAVWTTCMLFFQAVLLLGYLYSHLLTKHLHFRTQAIVHTAVILVSLAALRLGHGTGDEASHYPLLRVLGLLQVSIGLPYFVLSTTSPLMQAWYSRTGAGRVPYRLFALSNAASLLALILYPLLWETMFTLHVQILAWSVAYGVFGLLGLALRWLAGSNGHVPESVPAANGISWRSAGLWVLLAFCPSVLWLAIANHLSQSVAAIPFLWVLPLTLYLLSFVVTFERESWYKPQWARWLLPVAWVGMLVGLFGEALALHFKWIIAIDCASLFIISVFCHGELARRKPHPSRLTDFYLWVALGGAMGSVFVAVIAPLIFRQYLELPLALALAIVIGAVLGFGIRSKATLIRLAVTAGAGLIVALVMKPSGAVDLVEARNFYGALRVQDQGSVETAYRSLYNGTVLHGIEWLSPSRSRWATAYYGTESGVGKLLDGQGREPMRVGVIGLGVGTVAAYAEPGDYFRFYEINPLVIRVARHDFRFLAECRGKVDVVEGDARLRLEHEPSQRFDSLVVDAFSGDSIPVHLLTREAFDIYERHLNRDGVIAIHVTNKYLDLDPVLAEMAETIGMDGVAITSNPDLERRTSLASWVLLGRPGGLLERVRPCGTPLRRRPDLEVWTDDFHNLLQIIH